MKQVVLVALLTAAGVAMAMGPPMAAFAQSETVEVTTGTGFFVSDDGLILTNNHVVEDCSAVELRTDAGQQVVGQILARDAKNDLALIRSPARAQKVARFRTNIRVGEEIAAFGFPHSGLLASSGTFTTGTVTALVGLGDDVSNLQMSAPVQMGNSGGPLLDVSGNLVGVVSAKLGLKMASRTGDLPQNINFAIKSSLVKTFLDTSGFIYIVAPQILPILSKPDLADYGKGLSVFLSCRATSGVVSGRQTKPTDPPVPPTTAPPPAASAIERRRNVDQFFGHGAEIRGVATWK